MHHFRQSAVRAALALRNPMGVGLSLAVTTLAALAAAPAAAQAIAGATILDIRLGMAPEQVRPLLQAIAPGIRIGQMNWSAQPGVPTSIAALYGTVGRTGGPGYTGSDFDEHVQAGFGQTTQKAYYVMRHIGTKAREPWTMENLERSLLQRYGKPHLQAPGQMLWAFKADGSAATSADMCNRSELQSPATTGMTQPPSRHCGFTMSVLYSSRAREPGRVFQFSIGMYDHRLHVEDIDAIQSRGMAQQEGGKRKIRDSFGGNTPRL
jgi:hypothetical protein